MIDRMVQVPFHDLELLYNLARDNLTDDAVRARIRDALQISPILVTRGEFTIKFNCGAPAPLVVNGAMFVGCEKEKQHDGAHSVTIRWVRE